MTHGTLNLPPSNGTGRRDSVEGERLPLPCTPSGKLPFPFQALFPSEFQVHGGQGPSHPAEKGLVMCTVSTFPRVHLLLHYSV